MKPIIKKTITIVSAVVAALLVAVLILSLIVIKPIEKLGEYESAYVLESYNHRKHNNKQMLNDSLASIKFSVMRSLLELEADYNFKAVTVKNEDDEDVQKKYSAESFSDLRPGEGQYMIELVYSTTQTNKRLTDDDGKQIMYDRVILMIGESENKIQTVTLYPYLEANIGNSNLSDEPDKNGIIGSRYYNIYEFSAKMYTYKFYETIQEYYDPGQSSMFS